MADTDTREILPFGITDETTGEAPQFKDPTLKALENAGISAGGAGGAGGPAFAPPPARDRGPEGRERAPRDERPEIVMRADGGFDSRRIFALCDKLGITPYVRVGINSTTRASCVFGMFPPPRSPYRAQKAPAAGRANRPVRPHTGGGRRGIGA